MRPINRLSAALALALLAAGLTAAKPPSDQTLKLKIESPELDKAMLLQKLNAHGADHGMKFVAVDQDFDYRVEFDTFQHKNTGATLEGAGATHFSGAEAKVYDNEGRLLFSFTRETRYTDSGATNATAKEIIKRLIRWQKEQAKAGKAN